jgi:hypothetical protein
VSRNEDQLKSVSVALSKGNATPSVTVREFLSWFGAERRGYWIVASIRDRLNEYGLQTQPDFESAFIDSPIQFVRAEQKSKKPIDAGSAEPEPNTSGPYADPKYRVSRLAAANRAPISIAPTAPLQEAITLMLANNFSQLPVITSERTVKGMLSWKSIGTRLALQRHGSSAQDFMDPHQEVPAQSSLYEAIAFSPARTRTLAQHAIC